MEQFQMGTRVQWAGVERGDRLVIDSGYSVLTVDSVVALNPMQARYVGQMTSTIGSKRNVGLVHNVTAWTDRLDSDCPLWRRLHAE